MGFIRGVLAGLAIGYLTAPRSGKDTRQKLSEGISDLQGQWDEGVADVKAQFNSLLGQAEAKADEVKDKANTLADKAQNKVDEVKSDVKSQYNQERTKAQYNDKVEDAADATKSGINKVEDALKFN